MTGVEHRLGGQRTLRPTHPIDLGLTLGVLQRGARDPSMVMVPGEVWRATRTPHGPVTTRVTERGGELTMQAWGPGSDWALENFPALVGANDGADRFQPRHPVVADLHRRLRGLRLGRSGAVVEALVPTILEQKVIGIQARRSYASLVRTLGQAAPSAPGPRLRLPPPPAVLAHTPTSVFHRLNIERRRADAVRVVCSHARQLEETVDLPLPAAYARLTALPGIGRWTAAEVALVALGDADAVSLDDYHLPHQVAWALAREPRADDARMLELLEPYRGQRGRVIRMIVAAGSAPPRFGPRLPLTPIEGL